MLNSMRVGYWWSERKSQKMNVAELGRHFTDRGYKFIKIDLDKDIEQQGPFDAIIHKLSDLLCKIDTDEVALRQIKAFELFVEKHPEVIIVDSLNNVRKVFDRYQQYKIIENSELAKEDGVFTPTFVEMTTTDVQENLQKMKAANVKFPFVCKPSIAMGTRNAHKMSLIFNEKGLRDINPPCVAQTFINHNARLFKLFIIKDKYFVVERPSIKNFKPDYEYDIVHFDSHDVSKPYSSSFLTELDEEDAKTCNMNEPDKNPLDRIVKVITNELGLYLLGIDVIIENKTGRFAIIDMNPFPGYDGVDNFLELYCNIVIEEIKASRKKMSTSIQNELPKNGSLDSNTTELCLENKCPPPLSIQDTPENGMEANCDSPNKQSATNGMYSPNDFDSGIDTSDSCDERKNSKTDIPIKMYKKQHCRWHQPEPEVLQSVTEKNEKM